MVERNETERVETRTSGASGSAASRLVAVVISALVYGALVYVSAFTPQVFNLQLIYPAVGAGVAFGIWFGFWAGLGTILGTLIVAPLVGTPVLPLLPSFLVQGLVAWFPALFYRKDTVRNVGDWLRLAAISLVTVLIVGFVLIWNLDLTGQVPLAAGLRTIFPGVVIGDFFWMVVLGPVILNLVSPYVVKAGLKFRGFF
jgi:hypothetical protein